jgi:hypothetical protein
MHEHVCVACCVPRARRSSARGEFCLHCTSPKHMWRYPRRGLLSKLHTHEPAVLHKKLRPPGCLRAWRQASSNAIRADH